ncbi:MAG: ATP-dependent helicase [Candidatus Micrarchaeaceae archaeon]
MISYQKEPFSEDEALSVLHPIIREWFKSKYPSLTSPQRFAFKLIAEGKSVLITAPTGSGKTFSAFMSIISSLISLIEKNELKDKIYCVYISPLRALNNDIYKNLSEPLEEIAPLLGPNRIRVGIRTGDTTQSERQRQLKNPPHILVTTPESLAIMLNSEKFSEHLSEVRYVVIDEIHELANNKRGVHLSLSLERLAEMIGRDFIRIGLGATLFPIEEAARFLVGLGKNMQERDCVIVDATWDKKMEFKTISPVEDMISAEESEIEEKTYSIIDREIRRSKTVLIFTNTRSGTERVVFNLMKKKHYKEEEIAAHHGSLSRELRLGVEDMLKKGKLKCVVSSTSLELGVDIGSIDEVIQLGSPKSVTRALQRIGRSGHRFNDVAKGLVIVLNRDDLVECSVMLDAAKKRHLDSFSIPKNALDVLAQHIVGMALNKKWKVDEAFNVVKRAYPYKDLSKKDFLSLLEYLSGMYVGLESRRVYGKIWYDENAMEFGKRGRYGKIIYYLNIGTIPDEVAVDVFSSEGKWIGSIEEEFLSRLKPGDIFVLGGKLYKFERSSGMKCYVSKSDSPTPTIPPWFSEQLPLTYELALEIGKFREKLENAIRKEIKSKGMLAHMLVKNSIKIGSEARELLDSMPIDENAKRAIYSYFLEQILFADFIPKHNLLVVELTKDLKSQNQYLIFHSMFGRRINDTLSRIFGIAIGDIYSTDVGIMVNDNGFCIVVGKHVKVSAKDIEELLERINEVDIERILKENIKRTELMKRKFRHCSTRGFMVLRNYKGKKISVNRQQLSSQQLLKAVEEISENFPILKETYREIFEDIMDLPKSKMIINSIARKEIKYMVVKTPSPSPFSHTLITLGEADIVMMKDRRKHLKELHKQVLERLAEMG